MEDSYASLETLVRSGDDTFTGGVLADYYNGYGANDSLLGGGGNDTLLGESGNDILFGEAGNDSLLGGKGSDYIDGGVGDDQMIGGTGDDTYIVDSLTDAITESDASTITGGVDWVGASVSGYSLTSNVENLTLLSTATSGTGNGLANRLTGNGSNNILTGLAGNDTLIGQGGVDVLDGGDDNDYYIVGTATDTIQDSGGADTVQSSVAFDLSNALVAGGTAIEHLVYTGSGNVSLTGNAAQNSMTGAAGSDTLDGQAGIDTLIGGAGDDYYVLTTINTDVIVENEGSGTDTVLIDGTFSLSSWPDIENIELTAAVASVLTGNSQDNLIVGNILNDNIRGEGGDDTLTGTSAAGSGEIDTLTGGTGADLFVLGNSANVFYNNLPGTGDYASIRDFSVEQGDQLQLSGGATYFFDAGLGGMQSLLYRDADGNQILSAGDNLIADIIATGGGGENKNLVSSDLAKIAVYA
jgi:Ca2+-binding RTX toxin-like protein